MTVGELLTRVTSAELTEWQAYEEIAGTFGPERADLHAGIVAATIANVNRPKGKPAAKPADFMPTWDRPRISTPQQMATFLKALTTRLGGKIIRRGGGNGNVG